MPNPLYNAMNQNNSGEMNALLQRFRQFQQIFRGDPRQQIQQMLNSGQVSQQQYDAAVKKAQELQRLFRI